MHAASIMGGIGLLIALYVVVANASNTSKVAEGFAASGIDTIVALQGRGSSLSLSGA